MAWEMQQHMHGYTFPSIQKYFTVGEGMDGPWDRAGLEQAYVDTRGTLEDCEADQDFERFRGELRHMSEGSIAQYLAERAIEYGTTTNGAWDFYLADKWTTIPWCTDEENEQWWACA